MKKVLIILAVLPLIIGACKSDESPTIANNGSGNGGGNGSGDTSGVILKKELLYDKLWLNEDQTKGFSVESGGKYGITGSWEWVNDSDTMQVMDNAGTRYYIFNEGNTETIMEARLREEVNWVEYRTEW